ncbi:hypothetical protein ASPACDRAFT_116747 [Aspergillus aculeatus ATCC 16872]|uniref:Zn(2)-C6 fungal-type domain-containing protein n=1 Tax=Aspergillus aculeatus (strain ATCC 16872 / CBS 172.66 / WB 5094) TaxID=690307 RepID=A0A1L9X0F2_ASPA1|nr:uncharacterized protein ASPACDRAFT_116747 [Aspergillus aculeatus ATCC 16872]OJK01769.1 hypothetical protein ASPACDRAFT_116747 [Aspergillus aculeatus ATCC 16872]
MPSDTEQALSPIACEPCRQKKCKCDRTLPVCTQCSPDPSKCVYPESGKRGLPLGYLNLIEQRLADTEQALFEALTTIRELNASHGGMVVQTTRKAADMRPKNARMQEWSQLPLSGWAERERWREAKQDHYQCERTVVKSPPGVEVPPSNVYEMPRGISAASLPSRGSVGPAESVSVAESVSPERRRADRAGEVARRYPSLYF